MAELMAQNIIDKLYDYSYVVVKKPNLKAGIDAYLTEKGRIDLIVVSQ